MGDLFKKSMIDFDKLPRFRGGQFTILCLISEWAAAYEVEPAAIERQIPIAHVWCNSNPKRAPRRDPVRFLHNWMRIAKERGNLVAQEIDRRYRETIPDADMSFDEMVEIRKKNMESMKGSV